MLRGVISGTIRSLLKPFLTSRPDGAAVGSGSSSYLKDLVSFAEVEGDMAPQESKCEESPTPYQYPDFTFKGAKANPSLPRHIIASIGGFPTELMVWDSSRSAEFPPRTPDTSGHPVLIFVAGNPGLPDFYEHFLDQMYHHHDQKINIVAVGHLYHSASLAPPAHSRFAHSVDDQIHHKTDLYEQVSRWFPEGPMFICGHSIGAYISLEVAARVVHNVGRLAGVFLLFPTLQKILSTPNGQRQHAFFKTPIRQAVANLAALLRWSFAMEGKGGLIELVAELSNQPEAQARITAMKLLSYHSVLSALTMSDDEMSRVDEINSKAIDLLADKIVAYYGTTDAWVPNEHHEEFRKRWPHVEVHIDKHCLPHAFPLLPQHADIMAKEMEQWIHKRSSIHLIKSNL
ncbi:alpha/beta-hydrolase [Gonapodya prolifera JEL478]|uniref:Alpha/beta-hydrolase n=1 Tax=Gonapodya prolifera (strain JEL478) TaxID=1344416 RepID=A0A139ANR5_GONPJ|nr:alpha/beta-hydrolase [Gonapodya prolifera JEL478]|eukprot:KXS18368.1 alpha/beta-hydrolase [Gonapodya prolifera JEL478]